MSTLLDDLTPAQREAVTHFEGPLLVIAGAGSGKTRVITRRVAWLLEQGVKPWQILAITFTNKAAGEMRQRVEALVPGNRVWVSTFHSLGARLLRQYATRLGLDPKFTIYDQGDRVKMVKNALGAADIDHVRFTPETIQAAISKAKNQLLTPDKYSSKAGDFFARTAAHVYPIYEKKMRDANAVDFDDLLIWPALALQNNAELRAELDERFRFVLIDEYQDTNQAQYVIARGLSIDQRNLCVVGDPDQSIYRWRSADIRNILEFEHDYPDARVITLDKNYRSTQLILDAANSLIRKNRQRKPKELVTEKGEGMPVRVATFETGRHEADTIAEEIKAAVEQGRRTYRDFALFLRINALSRTLETAFLEKRIPYQIVRGLAFYERKENKDILAYLRLLLNTRDNLSFERAVNEPARGIGKVSLEHLRNYAEPRELSLLAAALEVQKIPAIKGKAAAGLREFASLIVELQKHLDAPPDELMRLVIERSGYGAMLLGSGDEDDSERLANIEELITAAGQFAAEDSSRTIADFLEGVTLASDVDGWDEKQDCVSVMTLHAAKGLEFPVVYMVAVEQGLLPHERSLSESEELEEERRLCFVGMTRAKEELNLCHARMREFRGQTLYVVPSMFLDELPTEGVEIADLSGSYAAQAIPAWRSGPADADEGWAAAGIPMRSKSTPRSEKSSDSGQEYIEGMVVEHEAYGKGRVVAVHGYGAMRTVKIRFGAAGERSFRAEKAKLTVVKSGQV
ncbi:MAG TPA: UvrD-helicase domain-containing protein [Gemmataceae bacterium]|nr:UvrD-helicase domain-containing protein [Gemmataceae bacterium]